MGRRDKAALPLALGALLVPGLAGAWDARGADVQRRVSALDHAWAALDHDGMIDDVAARVKQSQRPGWVGKEAWAEVVAGRTYVFGVGASRPKGDQERRIEKAESAARANVGALTGRDKAGGTAVDWYVDPDGAFYALAVMEFSSREAVKVPPSKETAPPFEAAATPSAPKPKSAPVVAKKAAPKRASAADDEFNAQAADDSDSLLKPDFDIDGYLARADIAIAARKYDEAKDDLELAGSFIGEDDERRIRYLDRLGRLACVRQDYDEAQGLFDHGMKLARALKIKGPTAADVYAAAGLCLLVQGEKARAKFFLAKALTLHPSEKTRRRVEKKLKALP